MSADVQVLKWNLCSINVCAGPGVTVEQAVASANLQHPTGVGPWHQPAQDDLDFGELAITCAEDPERIHYVFIC